MTGLVPYDGKDSVGEVLDDDGNWLELTGVSGYTENPNESPVRSVPANSGTLNRVGVRRPSTISVDTSIYNPFSAGWRYVKQQYDANANISFRYRFPERELRPISSATGDAVSIIQSGAVTGPTGADTLEELSGIEFGDGMAIKIGDVYYIVDKWNITSSAADIEVLPFTTAAVGPPAEKYSLEVVPAIRGPVVCGITSADAVSVGAEVDMTAPLSLTPLRTLPAWRIDTTA